MNTAAKKQSGKRAVGNSPFASSNFFDTHLPRVDFTDRPIPSFTDMGIFGPLGGPETELNRVEADLFQHSLLNRVIIIRLSMTKKRRERTTLTWTSLLPGFVES